MRSLLSVILVLWMGIAMSQSPHGDDFTVDCIVCHSPNGWKLDREIYTFQHDTTAFPLEGQHEVIDCKQCHSSLIFANAGTSCVSCHADMHSQTVGMDCARCHDSNSWLVQNITELHDFNGFSLLGVHATASCNECHQRSDILQFEPIGNECINCHREAFVATTTPNHIEAGYSTDCVECHNFNSFEWSSTGLNHDFFPLTDGHAITDCAACHTDNNFSSLPPDCVNCHVADFDAALKPNHKGNGFSSNCIECHTTSVDWQPATFKNHDAVYFPIYSGKHGGEWSECIECHTQPDDITSFSCLECHEHNQADMNREHNGIGGYSYHSTACLACHPQGNSEGGFDHSKTNFPLTGAHLSVECLECHVAGYTGTSTICADCHTTAFNTTTNPNHQALGISNDCATCHTTEPGWMPASMPNHNEYFVLNGAHAALAADCAGCHNGDYSETPNTCAECHVDDYNATINPRHETAGFSDDCASCHSEVAWQPAEFDHDGQYFPIYTGAHQGTWNECTECHTTNNYDEVNCLACHEHNKTDTDEEHQGISGYSYSSDACLACHPMGTSDGAFDHNSTNFPLTGAHVTVECASCHTAGYTGTSTLCVDCHTPDFNATSNPNHPSLGLSNDCANCHTTEPSWSPATFAVHNDYYVLEGAHAAIANDCASCHNGDYANTPNTCAGCHIDNYNATTDPNHVTAGYSTECVTCHSQTAWQPANFDHNNTNFPLTGAHVSVDCASCHTAGYAGTSTLCVDCHNADFNQATNPNHRTLSLSNNCASCHTTEPGWSPATFAVHNDYYLLQGAHASIANDCASCHNGNYANTPNTCAGCHIDDYNGANNPNHKNSGFSTDCASCHSQAAWQPATFDHDGQYFPIYSGKHKNEWNQCSECHTNAGNYSIFTCIQCHEHNNKNEVDNDHKEVKGYQYTATSCFECHPDGRD